MARYHAVPLRRLWTAITSPHEVADGGVETQELELTETLLRSAFDRIPVGISFLTPDRRVLLTNPALTAILGYDSDQLRTMSIADITHPDDRDVHVAVHRELMSGARDWYEVDKRYIHRDGRTVWATLHVAAIHGDRGDVEMLVSQIHDITLRVEQHLLDRWHALHDPLTAVGNRHLLMRDLAVHLERYRADSELAPAVLVLDVDGFKAVNDRYGHHVGDEVLQTVGRLLSACVTADDTVGRLGGDEFMAVLVGTDEPRDVLAVAQRLREGLASAFRYLLPNESVTASLGVAVAPPADMTELLTRADEALYEAKRSGGDRAVQARPSGRGWSTSTG